MFHSDCSMNLPQINGDRLYMYAVAVVWFEHSSFLKSPWHAVTQCTTSVRAGSHMYAPFTACLFPQSLMSLTHLTHFTVCWGTRPPKAWRHSLSLKMKLGRTAKGQRERDREIGLEKHLHCCPASVVEDLEMLLAHINANKEHGLVIGAFL